MAYGWQQVRKSTLKITWSAICHGQCLRDTVTTFINAKVEMWSDTHTSGQACGKTCTVHASGKASTVPNAQ